VEIREYNEDVGEEEDEVSIIVVVILSILKTLMNEKFR
jgi:hypothetical protein